MKSAGEWGNIPVAHLPQDANGATSDEYIVTMGADANDRHVYGDGVDMDTGSNQNT
ncbi:MAG: hypothetical protein JOZ32_06790 [Bryobacterales bacterium]|nr:hypothetical protein [Bryobacterales bacterium]